MKSITGKAKIAGVMGWPVSHSKSPRLHGFWLNKHAIDGQYIPMAVRPENIGNALRALSILGMKGANLTIPHKEIALPFLDEIDGIAKRVGAANTIVVREDGSLFGTNTDVYGFSQNLLSSGFSINSQQPVSTILGAGGAARAIFVALQDMGFQNIRIVNRDVEKAKRMAAALANENDFAVFGWDEVDRAMDGTGLLVNTTSLGMVGQPALQIDLSALPSQAWVTDAVYNPLMTDLLRQAQNKGLRFVDGLGMLLHQAKPAFEAWFGQTVEVTDELRSFILSEETK